jgi:hypothetical protein
LTGPTAVATGSAATYTVQPSGPITGTITAHVTGGILAGSTMIWSGTGTAKTFAVTPTGPGAITVSVTNTLGISDPSSIVLVPQATSYTLTGPSSAIIGAASTFTITPNGFVNSATINLTRTGSAGSFVGSSTITYFGSSAPSTFNFIGSALGTATITANSGGALINPPSASIMILPPATAVTITSVLRGQVGRPQTLVIALDAAGTARVTLSASGGALSTTTIDFTNEQGPKAVTFIPSAVGTATVLASNNAGLSNPSTLSVSISLHETLQVASRAKSVRAKVARHGPSRRPGPLDNQLLDAVTIRKLELDSVQVIKDAGRKGPGQL